MPILGVIAASRPPVPSGTYVSIATLDISSNTDVSTLQFSGISDKYVRLQLRGYVRTNRGDTQDALLIRFNGDSGGSNYSTQAFFGAGGNTTNNPGTATAGSNSSIGSTSFTGLINGNNGSGSTEFSPFLVDINNFSSSQYKNVYFIGGTGVRSTTNNRLGFVVGNWRNTSSLVTSITFATIGTQFLAGSKIALYGIKGE